MFVWQSTLLTRIFVITVTLSLSCIIITDECTFFAVLISMEEQVISRAHRMGATRPIQVETLAMRGTIEEQMLKLLQVCGRHMFMTFWF